MSIVKVQGNASGTGTLTIAAPNTSTDRTLTLPDATGTVQVSGQPVSATTGTFSGTISGGSTIGVGGATPSASGSGITFPASQSASTDANTLDDYEEGTFTPVLTDGTRTKNGTGSYTKVGNVVTVRMNFGDVENPNSFTGSVYSTGLPFTNSANISAAACFLNYSDSGNIFNAVFSASSTEARIYRVNAQYLDFVNLQGTDLSYYSDLFICGSYFV